MNGKGSKCFFKVPSALIFILLLALAGCGRRKGEVPASQTPPPPGPLEVLEEAPEFTLVDQDGQELSLSDLRGGVVVLDFIYASCRTHCLLLTGNFTKLQEALGERLGREVFLLSISFDPERDSPQVLKEYGQRYKADFSGWKFLTGRPEEISRVCQAYGVGYKKTAEGEFVHTLLTVVIDREGMIRLKYYGGTYDIQDLLKRIDQLLKEGDLE